MCGIGVDSFKTSPGGFKVAALLRIKSVKVAIFSSSDLEEQQQNNNGTRQNKVFLSMQIFLLGSLQHSTVKSYTEIGSS